MNETCKKPKKDDIAGVLRSLPKDETEIPDGWVECGTLVKDKKSSFYGIRVPYPWCCCKKHQSKNKLIMKVK